MSRLVNPDSLHYWHSVLKFTSCICSWSSPQPFKVASFDNIILVEAAAKTEGRMNILYWDWIENKTETLKHNPNGMRVSKSWTWLYARAHTHAHTKCNGMEMYGFFMFPLQSNNTQCLCCSSLWNFWWKWSTLCSLPHLSFTPQVTAAAFHPTSPCWNTDVIN